MLSEDVIEAAERLTRHARTATDTSEANGARKKRDALLARHGYAARERETDATLVCYPTEWVENGEIRIDRVENTDRAIERPLEASTDDWDAIDRHNRAVTARVTERHGDIHGANATAFREFMANHYAMKIEHATDDMREEFLTEYYPRNVWPSKKQRAVVETSIELALKLARE